MGERPVSEGRSPSLRNRPCDLQTPRAWAAPARSRRAARPCAFLTAVRGNPRDAPPTRAANEPHPFSPPPAYQPRRLHSNSPRQPFASHILPEKSLLSYYIAAPRARSPHSSEQFMPTFRPRILPPPEIVLEQTRAFCYNRKRITGCKPSDRERRNDYERRMVAGRFVQGL